MSGLIPVTLLLTVLGGLIHLAVDAAGVVLAIVFRRRARVAAVLALIAFAVAAPVHLLSLAWSVLSLSIPALVGDLSISLATVRAVNVAVFPVTSLVGAAIWAVLFSAVFADRTRRVPAQR
jgi:hypothetical protein